MPQPNDLSRSLVALDQNTTIIAVVELSQSSWLIGGIVPSIERQPHKKLEPSPERLLAVLHRWRDEAVRAGRKITRIALAFEAGRDGFWLARWLRARGVEAHVIHPSSVDERELLRVPEHPSLHNFKNGVLVGARSAATFLRRACSVFQTSIETYRPSGHRCHARSECRCSGMTP